MKKSRWILWIPILILIGWVIYFYVIDWELRVRFSANTVPGVAIQTLRSWSYDATKNLQIEEVDSLTSIKQRFQVNERVYSLRWQFNQSNDSSIQIVIDASEKGNRIWNKLLVPFTNTTLEQDVESLALNYYKSLKEYLESSRVKVIGHSRLEGMSCLCKSLVTRQHEKAKGMMIVYNELITYMNEREIQLARMPLIDVKQWGHNRDSLQFDFCFPVQDSVKVGQNPENFFIKTIPTQEVLKAEYFGNYINSDRAWYQLLEYSKVEGIEVLPLPKEVFNSDPNLGSDEMTWKTDVYLPVLNKDND